MANKSSKIFKWSWVLVCFICCWICSGASLVTSWAAKVMWGPSLHAPCRWLSWDLGAGWDSWALWGTRSSAQCCKSQPPNLPFWPKPKVGQTSAVSLAAAAPQRWWDWGFCPGSLEAVSVAAQCGVASRAMQPACTFSCFVLKYPLVSFFTSYSLYPKLCIPPLHGVIFLIAGRVLLLDTSLLLMRCVALRRARWTYLILQMDRDESSCSSAANARPKMWLLPVRLIDKTLTWGKSLLESWSPALLSCWEARQCCEVQQHRLLTVRTVRCQPLHGENLMSCSTTGYWW